MKSSKYAGLVISILAIAVVMLWLKLYGGNNPEPVGYDSRPAICSQMGCDP